MQMSEKYAELACATNFSFQRGASAATDLVLTSLLLGHSGLGIADRNTLAGVVRAWAAVKEIREGGLLPPVRRREGSGPGEYHVEITTLSSDEKKAEALRKLVQERAKAFRLVTGARLVFADGTPDIIAYPQNRTGWARLCRLLTTGNRRARKGECRLTLDDLRADAQDLLLILMPGRDRRNLAAPLARLHEAVPGAFWLGATMPRRGDDRRKLAELKDIGAAQRIPLLATNDVFYAEPGQRDLQDILTCIREGRTLENAGRLLEMNAERYLKHPGEMARLFIDCPEAISRDAASACPDRFRSFPVAYEYPDEPVPPGWDAQGWLEDLTFRHAAMRYPDGVPSKVEQLLHAELALIGKLDYARYFLTIHDIVRVANDKGILCQGRGSAANSAVCYVLGITCVDPAEHNVLFARFISEERRRSRPISMSISSMSGARRSSSTSMRAMAASARGLPPP